MVITSVQVNVIILQFRVVFLNLTMVCLETDPQTLLNLNANHYVETLDPVLFLHLLKEFICMILKVEIVVVQIRIKLRQQIRIALHQSMKITPLQRMKCVIWIKKFILHRGM